MLVVGRTEKLEAKATWLTLVLYRRSHQLHPAPRRGSSGSRSASKPLIFSERKLQSVIGRQAKWSARTRSKSTVIFVTSSENFKTASEAERQVRFVVVLLLVVVVTWWSWGIDTNFQVYHLHLVCGTFTYVAIVFLSRDESVTVLNFFLNQFWVLTGSKWISGLQLCGSGDCLIAWPVWRCEMAPTIIWLSKLRTTYLKRTAGIYCPT